MNNRFKILFSFIIILGLVMYSCDTDDTNPEGEGGLTPSSTSATIGAGQSGTITISGADVDDNLTAASDNDTIATAQITGTTLTIYGQSAGSTTITVSESGTQNTASILVTVTASSQIAGQFSFDYSDALIGSFTADGKFDVEAGNSSAAAYWALSEFDGAYVIVAYAQGSEAGKWDVVSISIDTLQAKSFSFGMQGEGSLFFRTDVPTADMQADQMVGYFMTSGSVIVTSIDNNTLTGTFTAEGDWFDGSTFDTSNHIVISSGTFSVPLMKEPETLGGGKPVTGFIENITKAMMK